MLITSVLLNMLQRHSLLYLWAWTTQNSLQLFCRWAVAEWYKVSENVKLNICHHSNYIDSLEEIPVLRQIKHVYHLQRAIMLLQITFVKWILPYEMEKVAVLWLQNNSDGADWSMLTEVCSYSSSGSVKVTNLTSPWRKTLTS